MGKQPTCPVSHMLRNAENSTDKMAETIQSSLQHSSLNKKEIISTIAVKMGDATGSTLLDIIHLDLFDVFFFSSASEHGNDCKDMVHRSENPHD